MAQIPLQKLINSLGFAGRILEHEAIHWGAYYKLGLTGENDDLVIPLFGINLSFERGKFFEKFAFRNTGDAYNPNSNSSWASFAKKELAMYISNQKKIFFTLLFIVFYKIAASQTAFTERNIKYLDSLEFNVKTYLCNGQLLYPEKYNRNAIKRDVLLVHSINQLFDADTNALQFENTLKSIKNAKITRSETINGLIKVIKAGIYGNYLRIQLTFECIDDLFFRKKLILNTTTNGRCTTSGRRVMDVKLLKDVFVKGLDFSIRSVDNEYLVAEDFLESKLIIAAKNNKGYIFDRTSGSDDDTFNRFLRNQFNSDSSCCYSYSKANVYFVMLVKSNKLDVIKDLLYSPNYFYSINAMEALLYLAHIKKLVIDNAMQLKMDSLKKAKFNVIIQRSPDVFVVVNGYDSLKMTDEKVVEKLARSM